MNAFQKGKPDMESPQVDFSYIRQKVTMQMVVEHYHLPLKRQGDELRGKCPFHTDSQAKRAFQVNTVKNVFYCFSCRVKGGVIDYVMKQENCSAREAGLLLWEWFQLESPVIKPGEVQKMEPTSPHNQQRESLDDQPPTEDQLARALDVLREEKQALEEQLRIGQQKLIKTRAQLLAICDVLRHHNPSDPDAKPDLPPFPF